MLQELTIKNFAIIEDLRISFDNGLTILSGETGAGKSIIINAFNLLLGSRPSAKLIRAGAESAEIEAVFSLPDGAAARKLTSHGYQTDGQLLIKRLVSGDNRHKVYLNGSLATLQVLTDVTAGLASISGQHAHQHLLREENHLLILDQFAGLLPLREQVRQAYQELIPLLRERERLRQVRQQRERQVELLNFQKEEIRKANLTAGEDGHLENEKNRLKHAERLYALVYGSLEGLYDAQGAVIEQLALVRKSLEEAERIDPALAEPREAAADITVRVDETAGRLRAYLDTVQRDDQRLEAVEDRLDLLSRLKKKYGQTLTAVLDHLSEIEAELAGLENIADTLAGLDEKIAAAHDTLADTARRLSEARKKAARKFSAQVARELAGLKMTGTGFEIAFSGIPVTAGMDEVLSVDGCGIDESGLDRAIFQISPNVGEPLKPLTDIASGGELSRVILALKAILADKEAVGTIVFDEVDAGIGGETADVVGKKLLALSEYHQVLCITHLPQIARFGDRHYKIEKEVSRGRTKTSIKALSPKERVQEIARMSGGEKITPATLAHAEEMLAQAGRSS
jgi:DNA repair protein RecN (Recombination protein N)